MTRSIRWRIALFYVLLSVLATVGFTLYVSSFLHHQYLDNLQDQLTAEAALVSEMARPFLADGADLPAGEWSSLIGARVTLIRADGVVLADSHKSALEMDNHLNRPEVQAALVSGVGVSTRFSATVRYEMMYAAVPIEEGNEVMGFARVSLPLSQIENRTRELRRTIAGASLVVVLLGTGLAFALAESVARPLRSLTHLAERVAQGDLAGRIHFTSQDEVGRLAQAFNTMAGNLEHQLGALADQRDTLSAVLQHMADGVVITGPDERVRLINPAAARVLGVSEEDAIGERFVAVARDHQVVELWRGCGASAEEHSETIEMIGQRPFIHVVVTPLRSAGCLVLFQDLTRIRRLETVRRDFISNISHELRTPLASLRAIVETLQDGALDDPPAATRFLGLMETEVDALSQMVEELLELSRIESGRVPLRLVPTQVDEMIRTPIERLAPQIKRAKLTLEIDLPEDLPLVLADSQRVGQVVTNLVHNAIKFTRKKGTITVSARAQDGEVVIAVQDTGVGIPTGDLERIFERFYKIDQARSSGGTGLGLAISRHLVNAHGGRIWVESNEGEGSTFSFSLRTTTGRESAAELNN